MEKEGFSNSLEALEQQGINIRSLTTGIHKKLRAACKNQSCALIQPWMQCVTNHLYFVAAMAEGDAELIMSMWRSLLNHICDKRDGHEGPFAECLHEPLGERLWMTPGDLFVAVMQNHANAAVHMGNFVFHDQTFLKLQTIVESPSLLRDIRQLSPKVQTYSLESFNSLLMRFAPKFTAFSEAGMKAR
ncbi:uncharacterized protein LOC144148545 [Haemaphysalis longicornis]